MRKIITSFIMMSLVAVTTWADNVLHYSYNPDFTADVTFAVDKNKNRIHYSGDIVIPDVVTYQNQEYKVTGVKANTFRDNTQVTSVTLGNNLKVIEEYAFNGCKSLTEITIPASVDSIGAWAFSSSSLKNVKIDDGETPLKLWYWSSYGIFNDNPLETVYLGRDYISDSRPFRDFKTIKNVSVGNYVTRLQSEEFKNCKGINNITLGTGITDIGNYAFSECDTLFAIILPESVLRIGDYAFYSCDSLFSINIPSKVKLIAERAFSYCKDLESITFPASVDSIGPWAFDNSGLKNVKFEDGDNPLKLWGWSSYNVFNASPLETVYLGRNYISITRPFRGFPTIKTAIVSDKVTALQTEEFREDRGLRSVRLGENIEDIGNYAFFECDTLFAIILPESVLRIGDYAFYSCDSLFSINIPSKVKLIAERAFSYCKDLESITFPASVDSIGPWSFDNSGLKNVKIEDGDNPLKLWGWSSYNVFNASPLESVYLGRNYISITRPFRGFPTIKTAIVSDKVTALQTEEFREDRGLRSVRLGENIEDIGNYAFFECDTLFAIILPESVLRIGNYAFYSCDSLFSINIPSKVKLIAERAFSYCKDLENITIPASVDSIGAWVFDNTGLKNVKIEDGDNPLKLWGWSSYNIFNSSPLETIYLGRNYISVTRPFRGFPTIKTAIVSDKVTALQAEEFKNDRGLRTVRLGENIADIGNSAFEECDTLYAITLPESVLRIGNYAFYSCDSLFSINIPSKVKLIAERAFEYCKDMESILIPASVDSIGAWVFDNTGLKNVIIQDGDNPLKLWGWSSYNIFNSSPLESVHLGRNYISETRPFRGFSTLKEVFIGNPVEKLQNGEFENCSNLEKISSYRLTPPTCSTKTFSGVNKQTCKLIVPEESVNLYKAAEYWKDFYSIESSVKNMSILEDDAISNGQWFDMNGKSIGTSKRGMNILRTNDGKAIKVFIP